MTCIKLLTNIPYKLHGLAVNDIPELYPRMKDSRICFTSATIVAARCGFVHYILNPIMQYFFKFYTVIGHQR